MNVSKEPIKPLSCQADGVYSGGPGRGFCLRGSFFFLYVQFFLFLRVCVCVFAERSSESVCTV